MKLFRFSLITIILLLAHPAFAQQFNALPGVVILGKTYSRYQVKKGDSLYGITKKFNWEPEILTALNPAVKGELKEGEYIYYPAGENKTVDLENGFRHLVRNGETVYSISRLYNVSPTDIYSENPGSETGIYAGSELLIKRHGTTVPGIIEHKIKSGETLFGIAKRYNTSLRQIFHDNPDISETDYKAGEVVRIHPNSNNTNTERRLNTTYRLISLKNYKVKNNDTWSSIAQRQIVNEDILRAANPDITELKKNMIIVIPNTIGITVEEEYPISDPRELTEEGRSEIYEEVQQQLLTEKIQNEIKIAIVLDDYESPKDTEFTRGFIYTIDKLKKSPFKISLKVTDGRDQKLYQELESFNPDIVVTTADKNYPTALTEFGNDNGCWVVNVFDTKDTSYRKNPKMIQLLPPSEQFNDAIGTFISERFKDHILLIAGEPESNDAVVQMVIEKIGPSKTFMVNLEDIENFETEASERYLVYASPTQSKEVSDIMNKILLLKNKNPDAEVVTMGRSSWIVLSNLNPLFCQAETFIPSRFYFDSDLSSSQDFINDYKNLYGHTPVKSFPVYAVTGRDVADFFIRELNLTGGDLTKTSDYPVIEGLQNNFELYKPENASGLLNPISYMLKYNRFGNIDKIQIK